MKDFNSFKEDLQILIRDETWVFCKVLQEEHELEGIERLIKSHLWRHTRMMGRLMEELIEQY